MSLRFPQLVKYLRANDVRLTLSGTGVTYDAPEGVVTRDVAAEMKRHKAELISYLKLKSSLTEGRIRNKLIHGDSEVVLSAIPDDSVDCIITDPPYGYGFMGNGWDYSVPRTDIWNECLRVLKPGAFAFIMSAPRQDVLGRQIFCIEEAGFRVDFTPLYWTYASGFPKVANVSKALDKKAGAVRKDELITLPATDRAKELDGAYAGFQPKPAVEVIIVAMKPLTKLSFIEQAASDGKGVTWLDDCRIPYPDDKLPSAGDRTCNFGEHETISGGKYGLGWQANNVGRYPANLLVSNGVLGEHSKFFDVDRWANDYLPFICCPKASKKEKDAGLEKAAMKLLTDRHEKSTSKQMPSQQKNLHPTVKPLKLMSYLITMGSREGDIVLDPFCGTGTTCIAAMMLKRDYLGVEISNEYHDIALRRIENYRLTNEKAFSRKANSI